MNKQGIVPGPEESKDQYLKRAEYCLSLKEVLRDESGNPLPFGQNDQGERALLHTSFPQTEKLYGIAPEWVPLFFSDYQLSLWQGGCAWIFQIKEDSPLTALIQLRRKFLSNHSYLGLYDRKEILTHELSHVGRLAFEEPKFEEFFAYRTSQSAFRKWFGPIVTSSMESLLFLLLLFLVFIYDISVLTLGNLSLYHTIYWSKLLPLTLIGAAMIRLGWRHRQLKRCYDTLKTILRDEEKTNALVYRLTDEEIIAFSKMRIPDILNDIREKKEDSFRWQVLNEAYF